LAEPKLNKLASNWGVDNINRRWYNIIGGMMRRTMKPKNCKHCGRPVSITVYNLGYCRKCIAKAKEEQK